MAKKTSSYKSGMPPESPYTRAKKTWDDRIGSAVKQAHNWRLMALFSMLVALSLIAVVVFLVSRSSVETYIVQVDKTSGEVLNVGNIKKSYVPQLQEYKYFIGQFIKKVRSVSSDRIIVQENWLTAYKFLTIKGNHQLTEYAKENDPFAMVGKLTVSVDIQAINKITNNSYQVEWVETIFNYSGGSTKKEFSGVLTVLSLPPSKKSDLINNPLGIFIDEISWSEKK